MMTRMLRNILFVAAAITLGVVACSDPVLDEVLEELPLELQRVLDDIEQHEVQVLYVQIDRDRKNNPQFTYYDYGLDEGVYFYPASTVKMPVAILALERLNTLGIDGLDRHSRMQTDSMRYPQSTVLYDTTSANRMPSVGHYAKKIFIVSDNDAYNRLYEFLGQEYINDRLHALGMNRTRIIHRLSDFRFGPEENRYTNPVSFFNADTLVYAQYEQKAETRQWYHPSGESKGLAFINPEGERINEPFDFSQKNFFPLNDQVQCLISVLFPESRADSMRFDLTHDDYEFLYKVMSMKPGESVRPAYPPPFYYDGYCKFLGFGDSKEPIPDNIRVFNKVGDAYGYLTDCAYIVDFDNNIEFILAATIHVNANQTFNDGVYEYDETGFPFLGELGRQVYDYELKRKRKRKPDLSRFKLDYSND